jgi:hypothetical protein
MEHEHACRCRRVLVADVLFVTKRAPRTLAVPACASAQPLHWLCRRAADLVGGVTTHITFGAVDDAWAGRLGGHVGGRIHLRLAVTPRPPFVMPSVAIVGHVPVPPDCVCYLCGRRMRDGAHSISPPPKRRAPQPPGRPAHTMAWEPVLACTPECRSILDRSFRKEQRQWREARQDLVKLDKLLREYRKILGPKAPRVPRTQLPKGIFSATRLS